MMETKEFFEGFEAALNLFDIELKKQFDKATSREVNGLLDAKNISDQLRAMMITNGEVILLTQDEERLSTDM